MENFCSKVTFLHSHCDYPALSIMFFLIQARCPLQPLLSPHTLHQHQILLQTAPTLALHSPHNGKRRGPNAVSVSTQTH